MLLWNNSRRISLEVKCLRYSFFDGFLEESQNPPWFHDDWSGALKDIAVFLGYGLSHQLDSLEG